MLLVLLSIWVGYKEQSKNIAQEKEKSAVFIETSSPEETICKKDEG